MFNYMNLMQMMCRNRADYDTVRIGRVRGYAEWLRLYHYINRRQDRACNPQN